MLQQETLHKDHWPFKFQGYQTYKNRRDATCRGTAILVKDGISHYEYPLNPTQIIATTVIIKASGIEIGVVSTYYSPSQYDKLFSISNTVLIARSDKCKNVQLHKALFLSFFLSSRGGYTGRGLSFEKSSCGWDLGPHGSGRWRAPPPLLSIYQFTLIYVRFGPSFTFMDTSRKYTIIY